MARVKRGVTAHAKHKKVLKAAKGYYGRRKNTIRVAKQAVEKAQQYAYRDRKRRKRTFRALWIQRINAAVREHGLTYGRFINGLSNARHRQSTARFWPISRQRCRRASRRWSTRPPQLRVRPSRRPMPIKQRPRRPLKFDSYSTHVTLGLVPRVHRAQVPHAAEVALHRAAS